MPQQERGCLNSFQPTPFLHDNSLLRKNSNEQVKKSRSKQRKTSNSLAYPNKKCTFANRVVRRSKSQNISALALSLNRYHKSATPPFYSDIQSDTSFLIIRCKDSARREQDKKRSQWIFFFHTEPQPISEQRQCKAREGQNEKPRFSDFAHPRLAFNWADMAVSQNRLIVTFLSRLQKVGFSLQCVACSHQLGQSGMYLFHILLQVFHTQCLYA